MVDNFIPLAQWNSTIRVKLICAGGKTFSESGLRLWNELPYEKDYYKPHHFPLQVQGGFP